MKSNTRTNNHNNNETIEDTMYSNPCEINNTCDDGEGAWDGACQTEEYKDAPFCGGPSMKECAGGAEVPEDEVCPGNDTDALGDPRGNDRSQQPSWVDEIHNEQGCQTRAHATPEHQKNLCNNGDYKNPKVDELRDVIEENTTTETADPAPAPVDTLPVTGVNDMLFGGALGLIALGTAIVRLVKN